METIELKGNVSLKDESKRLKISNLEYYDDHWSLFIHVLYALSEDNFENEGVKQSWASFEEVLEHFKLFSEELQKQIPEKFEGVVRIDKQGNLIIDAD